MIKLLIGGSPCTFWSIAQKNNRETEAEGLGWELFKNYLIAKEKFKPDFFLYENNKSAAQAIKEQISRELGVYLMYINSALVSAQNRQRFYAFNWEVEQPEDRGIIFRDILDPTMEEGAYQFAEISERMKEPICLNSKSGRDGIAGLQPSLQDRIYSINGKHTAVTTAFMPKIAEPIRIGTILTPPASAKHDSQWRRVYSINGKSATLCANGGGGGAKTGLYLCPTTNIKQPNIYEVKGGFINYKGEQHAVALEDGFYVIRTATPLECERLQTLPDNYTAAVSKAQRYKGLGNGWTAEVIIHILNGALKDVPRDEEIIVLSMYDGIGTGRYCLDKMGFTNVKYFAYEIDKYAKQIAMSNYPDIIQMGDAFDIRHPDWTIGY